MRPAPCTKCFLAEDGFPGLQHPSQTAWLHRDKKLMNSLYLVFEHRVDDRVLVRGCHIEGLEPLVSEPGCTICGRTELLLQKQHSGTITKAMANAAV